MPIVATDALGLLADALSSTLGLLPARLCLGALLSPKPLRTPNAQCAADRQHPAPAAIGYVVANLALTLPVVTSIAVTLPVIGNLVTGPPPVKNSRAFQSPGLTSLSSASLQLSMTGMYQDFRSGL